MPPRGPVQQSAVLAYRRRKRGVQFLLVTSLETRRWVLPKGHVEHGMSPRDSALREAWEEAGIEGTAAARGIGTYVYEKTGSKGGGLREVTVYPMAVSRVRERWPERGRRRRRWMGAAEAGRAVAEADLKKLIARFAKTVEREHGDDR